MSNLAPIVAFWSLATLSRMPRPNVELHFKCYKHSMLQFAFAIGGVGEKQAFISNILSICKCPQNLVLPLFFKKLSALFFPLIWSIMCVYHFS